MTPSYISTFTVIPTWPLQLTLLGCCVGIILLAGVLYIKQSSPVYLVDYACFKPDDWWVLRDALWAGGLAALASRAAKLGG